MSISVCVSVCPQGYCQNHTHDLYQKFFVHVAYVRDSVLLWHVYDRLHRLLLGRGFLPQWKCIISRERGGGMAVHSAGEVCYLRLPYFFCGVITSSSCDCSIQYIFATNHFGGPGRAIGHVCVWTITCEQNDVWPRHLASWFNLTLCGSNLEVKVTNKSSWSREELKAKQLLKQPSTA